VRGGKIFQKTILDYTDEKEPCLAKKISIMLPNDSKICRKKYFVEKNRKYYNYLNYSVSFWFILT
jgi:hypothetical protein